MKSLILFMTLVVASFSVHAEQFSIILPNGPTVTITYDEKDRKAVEAFIQHLKDTIRKRKTPSYKLPKMPEIRPRFKVSVPIVVTGGSMTVLKLSQDRIMLTFKAGT